MRVLWDLHHPFRTNGELPDVTYANLAPYTVSIHVKDSVPLAESDGHRNHSTSSSAKATCPLKRMLDLLVAGGYDGYAILEWEKRWIPTSARARNRLPAVRRQDARVAGID